NWIGGTAVIWDKEQGREKQRRGDERDEVELPPCVLHHPTHARWPESARAEPAQSVRQAVRAPEAVGEPIGPAQAVREPVRPAQAVGEAVRATKPVRQSVRAAQAIGQAVRPAESVCETVGATAETVRAAPQTIRPPGL